MGERDNGCNHYFIRPVEKWDEGEWRWDFSNREPMPLPFEAEDNGLLSKLSHVMGDGRLRNVYRRLRELTHLG